MATILEKPVTRRVPEITNDEGRALEASLTPDNGGSVALRWVGLRREPNMVRLRDLAEGAGASGLHITSAATTKERSTADKKNIDRTEWVRYEDIMSKINITPMDINERERITAVLKGIREHWEDLNDA